MFIEQESERNKSIKHQPGGRKTYKFLEENILKLKDRKFSSIEKEDLIKLHGDTIKNIK